MSKKECNKSLEELMSDLFDIILKNWDKPYKSKIEINR